MRDNHLTSEELQRSIGRAVDHVESLTAAEIDDLKKSGLLDERCNPAPLNRSVVVRMSPAMYDALSADALRSGRTVSQSIRFHLRVALNGTSE